MSTILEMLAFWLFVAMILLACFVFQGTPDLWDKLHDRAMTEASCKP